MFRKLTAVASSLVLTTGIGAWVAQGSDDDDPNNDGAIENGAIKDGASKDGRVEVVRVHDADGDRVGSVRMLEAGGAVHVDARLRSLEPGHHGFHVHETGVCDPDAADGPFTSAGGHYAGDGEDHGDHAGDLPSLLAMDDGNAQLSFATDRFTLDELRDDDGSAIMVHSGPDNYANIPDRYTSSSGAKGPDEETLSAGDAGDRVACGAIEG